MERILLVQGPDGADGLAEMRAAAGRLHGGGAPLVQVRTLVPAQVDGDVLGPGSAAGLVQALDDLQRVAGFEAILFRGTAVAGAVTGVIAARLAARLGAPLVTEAVDVRHDPAGLVVLRRTGDRQVPVRVTVGPGTPLVVVIRPGAFAPEPGALPPAPEPGPAPAPEPGPEMAEPTPLLPVPEPDPGAPARVARRTGDPGADIRDADILVSGGAGVAGSFAQLHRLAEALGGRVAASRRIVDMGTADRAIQVGQSGRTVSPRLYLALGIDGAGQHLEGLREIGSIIAVNTNRRAPICSIADVVVEGDAADFIDRLCRRLALDPAVSPGG